MPVLEQLREEIEDVKQAVAAYDHHVYSQIKFDVNGSHIGKKLSPAQKQHRNVIVQRAWSVYLQLQRAANVLLDPSGRQMMLESFEVVLNLLDPCSQGICSDDLDLFLSGEALGSRDFVDVLLPHWIFIMASVLADLRPSKLKSLMLNYAFEHCEGACAYFLRFMLKGVDKRQPGLVSSYRKVIHDIESRLKKRLSSGSSPASGFSLGSGSSPASGSTFGSSLGSSPASGPSSALRRKRQREWDVSKFSSALAELRSGFHDDCSRSQLMRQKKTCLTRLSAQLSALDRLEDESTHVFSLQDLVFILEHVHNIYNDGIILYFDADLNALTVRLLQLLEGFFIPSDEAADKIDDERLLSRLIVVFPYIDEHSCVLTSQINLMSKNIQRRVRKRLDDLKKSKAVNPSSDGVDGLAIQYKKKAKVNTLSILPMVNRILGNIVNVATSSQLDQWQSFDDAFSQAIVLPVPMALDMSRDFLANAERAVSSFSTSKICLYQKKMCDYTSQSIHAQKAYEFFFKAAWCLSKAAKTSAELQLHALRLIEAFHCFRYQAAGVVAYATPVYDFYYKKCLQQIYAQYLAPVVGGGSISTVLLNYARDHLTDYAKVPMSTHQTCESGGVLEREKPSLLGLFSGANYRCSSIDVLLKKIANKKVAVGSVSELHQSLAQVIINWFRRANITDFLRDSDEHKLRVALMSRVAEQNCIVTVDSKLDGVKIKSRHCLSSSDVDVIIAAVTAHNLSEQMRQHQECFDEQGIEKLDRCWSFLVQASTPVVPDAVVQRQLLVAHLRRFENHLQMPGCAVAADCDRTAAAMDHSLEASSAEYASCDF